MVEGNGHRAFLVNLTFHCVSKHVHRHFCHFSLAAGDYGARRNEVSAPSGVPLYFERACVCECEYMCAYVCLCAFTTRIKC